MKLTTLKKRELLIPKDLINIDKLRSTFNNAMNVANIEAVLNSMFAISRLLGNR